MGHDSLRLQHAELQRATIAEGLVVGQDAQALELGDEFFQHLDGVVGAAVLDDDDLVVVGQGAAGAVGAAAGS